VSPRTKLGRTPFTHGPTNRRPWWVDLRHSIPYKYLFMINFTCYVHSFFYSFRPTVFSRDGHVSSRRAVSSSVPKSQNFHTKQTSSHRVVHRRLHILTRVAMQNILSPRNHVSRRLAASSVVYRDEDLVYFAYAYPRYDSMEFAVPFIDHVVQSDTELLRNIFITKYRASILDKRASDPRVFLSDCRFNVFSNYLKRHLH